MGLVMALYVARIVSFCFPHVVDVSALSICIVLRAFVVVIFMCLLYMNLGSRVSPSIFGLMFMGSVILTQPTSGGAVTVVSSCCANCVEPPRPRFTVFGHAGHADPLDGWRCCSQKRVMSRPIQVPTTPACTWWNRPEEDNSSGKLESTHPSRTSVKSDQVFFVSSQSCVSTLTHYSSELLLPRHQGL